MIEDKLDLPNVRPQLSADISVGMEGPLIYINKLSKPQLQELGEMRNARLAADIYESTELVVHNPRYGTY